MARIKTAEDIEFLREGGRKLAIVLKKTAASVRPGMRTKELDILAERLIREGGDVPSFLHYKPSKSDTPYPASLCVSVNDEIVHAIPGDRVLEEGDIVGLDLGLAHHGRFVDSAVTVGVGEIDKEDQKLIDTTREALSVGIRAARGGNTLGDIGYAIQDVAARGKYGIPKEISGHGVGHAVHEDPRILNTGKKGEGEKLEPGMVLALEPMFARGSGEIVVDEGDGHSIRMRDGGRSAHFEHTILITEGEPEVLTK
jgi:methionyl aminopeptidase|tara:strand:+ start:8102 stop:8866 length:765 start_codon:yes stop_codon:yes gene_type:complete